MSGKGHPKRGKTLVLNTEYFATQNNPDTSHWVASSLFLITVAKFNSRVQQVEQLEISIRRVKSIERCRWRWPLRCREDQRTRGEGSYNFKKKPTSPMPLPSPRQRLLAWSLNSFAFLCFLYHFLASFSNFTWAVCGSWIGFEDLCSLKSTSLYPVCI